MSDWWKNAACKNKPTRWFYPERGEQAARAKEVCASCQVHDECLKFALESGQEYGIWAGRSCDELQEQRKYRMVRCRQCVRRFRWEPEEPKFSAMPSYCSATCREAADRIRNQESHDRRRAMA